MKQWDYLIKRWQKPINEVQNNLRQLGLQKWELVSLQTVGTDPNRLTYICVLKREITKKTE
jgi:hypothetical protein